MDIDSRTGLVLEGGGMRAIFTVGVLDCFMDHDIWFPYTIGVSAGASNGISYASRQRGRSRFSNIDLLEKYDYIGFRHFLRGRGYIDMKYLFYIYPEKYYPLDYETYFKSPNRFVMVTSNCLTGKAEYFEEKQDADRLVAIDEGKIAEEGTAEQLEQKQGIYYKLMKLQTESLALRGLD